MLLPVLFLFTTPPGLYEPVIVTWLTAVVA